MFKFLISSILAIGIIFVLFRSIELNALVNELSRFNLIWLLVLIPLVILVTLLRSWRFMILLHNSQIKISFWQTTKIFTAGYTTSALPGGEAMRALLVQRQTRTTLPKATSSVLAQAYFELFSAALTTVIGSLLFKIGLLPATIVLSGLILLALMMVWDQAVDLLTSWTIKIKFLNRLNTKLSQTQSFLKLHLYDSKSHLPDKTAVRSIGIGLLINITGGITLLIISLSYHTPVHLFFAIFAFSAALLIQGLAFTPGGLGFTEGGLAGLLVLGGIPFDRAFSIVVIYRALTLLLPIILGAVFWLVFFSKISNLFSRLSGKIH